MLRQRARLAVELAVEAVELVEKGGLLGAEAARVAAGGGAVEDDDDEEDTAGTAPASKKLA